MTPKKFAGFNLDKLFEDSEASKAREAGKLSEEERKKKLEEKLEKAKGKRKPTEESTTELPSTIVPVDYKNLQIEPKSQRTGTEKTLFAYDKSLEDLRTRLNNPSARHLRPQEVFGIIIDGLEGKLSGNIKTIYDDLVSSYGEWFSVGMERKKNKLILYEDIEGLVWDGNNYVQQNFAYSGQPKTFDIKGIASETYVDLNKFKPELVEYLYGRQFDALPNDMKTGGRKAQLWLPSENMGVRPVGRGYYWYSVIANFSYRASRGVVPVVAPKNSP